MTATAPAPAERATNERVELARCPRSSIERFPVDFVISSASCPNLSEGATIEGSGTMHSVTRIDIRVLPDDGPGGWCDPKRKEIAVAAGPVNRQVRTLIHELGHALGLEYGRYGRKKAEVLVDCVTYVVCSSAGLDVGGASIPYIAGWGEDGALDAVRECAQTIDEIARRIENALSDGLEATAAQAEQAA